jgi:hypothetical protein
MTVETREPDFSGWATKFNVKCSDGRTIMEKAFEHQDQEEVPLVWHHGHDDPGNIIGHAMLTYKPLGVWADAWFNENQRAMDSKEAVRHHDIKFMSIYANQLFEKSKQVFHGMIREVSLVVAGANPGARIENVAIAHGEYDEDVELQDAGALIYTDEEITVGGKLVHADGDTGVGGRSYEEIYNALDDDEKELVHVMIDAAVAATVDDGTATHSATDGDGDDTVEGDEAAEVDGTDDTEEPDDATNVADADTTADSGQSDESQETAVTDAVDGSPDASQAAEPTPAAPNTGDASDTATTDDEGQDLAHQEGSSNMTVNLFEQNGSSATGGPAPRKTLTRDQIVELMHTAEKTKSLKDAFLAHAVDYGLDDITLLFPDAKTVTNTPEMIQRRVEWVAKVIDGTKKTPFAKVRSLLADITGDEARAKGYTKGKRKLEEVVQLLRRSTGPTTIYKKQKLDRDDLIDITDFNLVEWLWAEINMMLLEELARAILVGDGRSVLSDDKIKDPAGAVDGDGIRSVLHDDDLYSIKVEMPANVSPKNSVTAIVRAMSQYRGSGKPTLFISSGMLIDIMLSEDKFERPVYETEQVLADKLRVKEIVTVDLFDEYDNLFAILVNLQDYSIGTNAGGQLARFDDFDIDFNQYKYLLETRLSGGLTKPYSAIVVRRAVGTLAVATAPSFNGTTDTITVPNTTGVSYFVNDEEVTGDVHITGQTEVTAAPDDGYYLESNTNRSWVYTP